ncbi:MAG: AMP-binding protein, partial [Desulfomonilia bacterium]
ACSPAPLLPQNIDLDLACLIYTSGTTGEPKGVMCDHSNVVFVTDSIVQYLGNTETDVLLNVLPMAYSYGLYQLLAAFYVGATLVLEESFAFPDVILDRMEQEGVTGFAGVPTIYSGLLANERFRKMDLSFVKGYFGGAAPLPEDTLNQLKELHGAIIYDVYGATENTAFATATPWGGKVKIGTVGVPLPSTDLKIVDVVTGTKDLPVGEAGEICIKGPQVMKEYYKNPAETNRVIRDGWFYIGDIGYLDQDGYLTISDRKKDMVISGGFNVYPKEVDEILFGHPKVFEACCIGIPDQYRGESLKAFIVLKPGEDLAEEEVISFCKGKMASYKVPKEVEFIGELPKSALGKILRRELREIDKKKREGKS